MSIRIDPLLLAEADRALLEGWGLFVIERGWRFDT